MLSSDTKGLLDLRLSGIDATKLFPLEETLLLDRLTDLKHIRLLEISSVITAIQEAAIIIAAGEGKFSKTPDMVNKLRGFLFPEYAEDVEDKAAQTKKLLEREFDQGPLKIQALDYAKQKRGKRKG